MQIPLQSTDAACDLSTLQRSCLQRLEAARAAMQAANDRVDGYDGNNPDKHQTQLRNARREVAEAEEACKACGALAQTPYEALARKLNALYPDARSGAIVHFEAQHFQRVWVAGERSRSGKSVREWEGHWRKLDADDPKVLRLSNPDYRSEQEILDDVIRSAWPFEVAGGGLRLKAKLGEPALSDVVAGKSNTGYDKGRPQLRTQLRATVVMTPDALLLMQKNKTKRTDHLFDSDDGKTSPVRRELYLGQDASGLHVFVVKTGRAQTSLTLDRREVFQT